ncbi:tubulin-specific chaperone A-like [Peromyscus eremicus]|uniref:tubulin-specific chaperone A-like n=1 Tax=Peromyscus eremicus TaxID=42410 RepID=UPI0027DB306D|nr:tubulin-specific chaperone A-like [Peromyscus eremicus]
MAVHTCNRSTPMARWEARPGEAPETRGPAHLASTVVRKGPCVKQGLREKKKIERMKAEDGENYAIKKQAEILQESRMMIPDCQCRLEAAYTDLQQILESEKDLEEAEEYKEARVVLDSVKLKLFIQYKDGAERTLAWVVCMEIRYKWY